MVIVRYPNAPGSRCDRRIQNLNFKYVFCVCDVHKGRRHLFSACFLTNTLQAKKNILQKNKYTKKKIGFIETFFLLFLCDF